MNSFPDLNAYHDEMTLEHASVLLERLGKVLDQVHEDGTGYTEFSEITEKMDPQDMLEDLKSIFTPEAFASLFDTEFGKGVIIGAFVNQFILPLDDEDSE